jgi:hypothetical protein
MSQETDNIVKERSRRFDEEKDEEHSMVLASAMYTMVEIDSLSERAEEKGSVIDDSEDSVVND